MEGRALEINPAAPPHGGNALDEGVERVLEPTNSRLNLADLYRDLPVVRVLAARDFKVKYKQSLLGPLWLVIQPLLLLLAFFVAFRGLADVKTAGIPYLLFALTGLTVWAFFQAAMTLGTASIISNAHLVRFTPCPRLAFPLASLVASLPAMGVTLAASLALAIGLGQLSPRIVLLPLAMVWLFALTAALVAIFAAFTVRFRDVMNGLPFLLQVGIFVAPVGYPRSALGPLSQWLVDLNPLTGIIETWRWMVLPIETLAARPVAISMGLTCALIVIGWFLFSRFEVRMADEI